MGEYQTPLHIQNKRCHVHVRLNSDMTGPGSCGFSPSRYLSAPFAVAEPRLHLWDGERGLKSRKLFKSWEIPLWKCRELSKQSREEFLTKYFLGCESEVQNPQVPSYTFRGRQHSRQRAYPKKVTVQ